MRLKRLTNLAVSAFAGMTLYVLSFSAQAAVFYPTSFTLDNGLQIVVVPNRLSPAVTQMVWYKVGSADEERGRHGLAHYLEHLMFRGTKTLGPSEFSKLIARQGGEDNAFTSFDYTAYHETVAADRLPLIMRAEADRMQNLQIKPETASPELSVVLDERQQRTDNNPQGRFNEKLRHLLLPNYPYGVPVIGWKNDIEKLTVADAKDFYKKYYAPNNAIIVISGDVDPEEVKKLANEIYGGIPKGPEISRSRFPSTPSPKQRLFVMKDAGIEQAQIQASTVVPSYATQKGKQAYAYEVLAEALDGGQIGPLYQTLVVEKQIASGVDADYDPDARDDTLFTISLTPRPGKSPYKLEKDFRDLLGALAKKGLKPDEIENAKKRLTRSAIFARDNLMMPGYAFGMALTTGHSVADVEEWPDRIAAVSAKQVNQALRDLTANPHHITGMLLPDEKASPAQREEASPLSTQDRGIR